MLARARFTGRPAGPVTDQLSLGEGLVGAGAQFLPLEPDLDGMRARHQRVLARTPRAFDRLAARAEMRTRTSTSCTGPYTRAKAGSDNDLCCPAIGDPDFGDEITRHSIAKVTHSRHALD